MFGQKTLFFFDYIENSMIKATVFTRVGKLWIHSKQLIRTLNRYKGSLETVESNGSGRRFTGYKIVHGVGKSKNIVGVSTPVYVCPTFLGIKCCSYSTDNLLKSPFQISHVNTFITIPRPGAQQLDTNSRN